MQGKIGYVDLEGGYYTLTTEKGEIYKLDGGGADLRKKGIQAEVEGAIDEGGFGIGFGTPVIQVKKYTVK